MAAVIHGKWLARAPLDDPKWRCFADTQQERSHVQSLLLMSVGPTAFPKVCVASNKSLTECPVL